MAKSEEVAKRDGPHRTNVVTVQTDELAPGYKIMLFNQTEMTSTGLHKVLDVVPGDEQAPGPRFWGRPDKKGEALDFDLADKHGTVQREKPHGHHATPLGDRRFAVELGLDEARIFFRGTVTVRLGFVLHAEPGAYHISGGQVELRGPADAKGA